jgi:hypothetical protein
MALSATQVIRTFDYYNTLTMLPGFTVPGYEDEHNIAKAHYSTDFSSNPIGSKVDFFAHLNDPCLAIYAPNPVFTINKPLSALDPQWFNGWWDQAMYYSHPLVTDQVSAENPNIYQNFSDSVGTMAYAPTADDPADPTYGDDAVSSAIASKIPSRISGMMKGLNSSVLGQANASVPAALKPVQTSFLSQVAAVKKLSTSLQGAITNQVGPLKAKLPFSTNITGNLLNTNSWTHSYNIEGVNSVVSKANNIIAAPGKMLTGAINKVTNLIPKINLPSINKLVGAYVPNMPAVSNVVSNIQSASTVAKTAISTAQSTLAAGAAIASNVTGTISNVTGQVAAATSLPIKNTVSLTNFNQTVTSAGGNVISGVLKQSPSNVTPLANNPVTIITPNLTNAQNNKAVITVLGAQG